MRTLKIVLISFVVSCVVFLFFSWPLPRYFGVGIGASGQNVEKYSARKMIPGDHLQLLYHFWLFSDMLAGKTSWFTNPYEFDTGDDLERQVVDAFYFPFSLIYSVFSLVGGRAFGWNITGFMSVWMTYLFTWLLAKRLSGNELISAGCALLSITLPYRWLSLLGGSPTGFAMAWVPLLLLGIDIVLRDGRKTGGFIAGLALLFACWSDLHVFFFCVLATPAWACLVLFDTRGLCFRSAGNLVRCVKAALPAVFLGVVVVAYSMLVRSGLDESLMGGGRTLREVALFSPVPSGLFGSDTMAFSSQIFMGWCQAMVLAGGILIGLLLAMRRFGEWWSGFAVFLLLVAGIALVALLASGPRGVAEGRLFILARKLLPSYDLIRQPAKIFCLMPTMLAVVFCLVSRFLIGIGMRRATVVCVTLLCVLACCFEFVPRVNATVCLLDSEQPAYGAVAESAERNDAVPRVLVLVLWPGDSHYASVYQYYCSLYRIRMVNGYSPRVPGEYVKNVFRRFEPMNQGGISDRLLDDLLDMGVDYVLLHENLFPEKVSPFPVAFTLKALLEHPRLAALEHSGPVWAFRILRSASDDRVVPRNWNVFFPARSWDARTIHGENLKMLDDPSASTGGCVDMRQGSILETRPVPLIQSPGLRWMVRMRGNGDMEYDVLEGVASLAAGSVGVNHDDWRWFDVPAPGFDSFRSLSLKLRCTRGEVQVDDVLLVAGKWNTSIPDSGITLPASCFFHAGYTDTKSGAVCLRKMCDPDAIVLYGPRLPLDAGDYEFTIGFSSDAEKGTRLAMLDFRYGPGEAGSWNTVTSGDDAKARLSNNASIPVVMALRFLRNADMRVEHVTIRPVKTP